MIWLMDGKGVYASGSLGPVPTTFSVAGTGDFAAPKSRPRSRSALFPPHLC
jgi:hypothetical protein